MSNENRVDYLLRAAARAEREGNARLAAILRRMADELGAPELGLSIQEPRATPS